jgi:squalene cyclase
MKPRGCLFVPVPERKIYTRDDLDVDCLKVNTWELNKWLAAHRVADVNDLSDIYLVSVDPDGEQTKNNETCYYHPKTKAREWERMLQSPYPGSEADHFKRVCKMLKNSDNIIHTQRQIQKEYVRERKRNEINEAQLEIHWGTKRH